MNTLLRIGKRKHLILLLLIALLIAPTGCNESPKSTDSQMKADFQNPPDNARPRVWWHWMNGSITKDGIQKDLEWMQRVGIRGFHNFDANLFTPVVVENPLVFMTDAWKDAFRFTTILADSLGFEMTIAGSPGWSVTGGPWVEAKDAMKKYVWTETRVEGGQIFNGVLPQPSDAPGNFQNIRSEEEGVLSQRDGGIPDYYKDAMLIA